MRAAIGVQHAEVGATGDWLRARRASQREVPRETHAIVDGLRFSGQAERKFWKLGLRLAIEAFFPANEGTARAMRSVWEAGSSP